MFEVLVAFVFVWGIVFVKSFWISLGLLMLMFVLIGPGVYAMAKGAPFVPSKDDRVKVILKLGGFGPTDKVYDLGCGDGKLVRAIAGTGVRQVIGYEYSIGTFLWALWRSRGLGQIKFGNFWRKDFSDADGIVLFLMDFSMERFEREIWPTLKTGCVVVSNDSPMKGLKEDNSIGRVYLYRKKN